MPCPNCTCDSCVEDRVKPDGWRVSERGVRYLMRNDLPVAMVYRRSNKWSWWNHAEREGHDGYATLESAKQAAEAATLPAGSTPDPTK